MPAWMGRGRTKKGRMLRMVVALGAATRGSLGVQFGVCGVCARKTLSLSRAEIVNPIALAGWVLCYIIVRRHLWHVVFLSAIKLGATKVPPHHRHCFLPVGQTVPLPNLGCTNKRSSKHVSRTANVLEIGWNDEIRTSVVVANLSIRSAGEVREQLWFPKPLGKEGLWVGLH